MQEQRQSRRLVPSLPIVTQSICHSVRFRPRASWDVASGALDSTLVMWYAVTHSNSRINCSQSESHTSSEGTSECGTPRLRLAGGRSLDERDFLAPLGYIRFCRANFAPEKNRAFFKLWSRRDFSTGRVRRKIDFVEGDFEGSWSPSASSSSSQKVDVR